jgi:GcrA cell cycle regulator
VLHQTVHPAPLPAFLSAATGPQSCGSSRRRWTAGELTEIVAALATLRTSDIARAIGVNPKALRSVLRRHGISLRALRESGKGSTRPGTGLLLRRTNGAPSATYGALALAALPEGACRWPIGDPAKRSFAFCGAPRLGRRSYCAKHFAQALQCEDDHER